MIQKLVLPITVAVSSLALAAPAKAEGTAREVLQMIDDGKDSNGKDAKGILTIWLSGNMNGIMNANIELVKLRKTTPIYCPPEELTVLPDQNLQILRDFVREKPTYQDYPVGLVMLQALKWAFPCQ